MTNPPQWLVKLQAEWARNAVKRRLKAAFRRKPRSAKPKKELLNEQH